MSNRLFFLQIFFTCIFLLILGLYFIHSGCLLAQTQMNALDSNYKNKIILKIDSLLQRYYVLPDQAKEYAEKLKLKHLSGAYDSCKNINELAQKVTADLIDITNDRHILLRKIESSDMGEKIESALHHPLRLYRLRNRENFGFHKLEWIADQIGYLDLRRFYSMAEAKDMALSAMTFLENANAIIIDLRENQGGSGESIPFFCNYFFKEPVQLTSYYSRSDDFLTEFWTSDKTEGARLTEVPLFLLTSDRTFSAAEAFAYDMQVRKRATIIGDSTKGGANSVDLFKIDEQLEMYISTARAINPVTGGNWEGTGVIPDIVVPESIALDTTIVLARAAGEEYGKKKEAKLKPIIDQMQSDLNRVEILYRQNKLAEADAFLDSVFQQGKRAGLINEFFISVLAYNYSSKADEQILYAILKKNVEFFPQSSTAHELLAYTYFKNEQKEQAINQYKKVLQLDPQNRNAVKMIERLQNE
jgi:tetratricopeptide (TPR) repeat protein